MRLIALLALLGLLTGCVAVGVFVPIERQQATVRATGRSTVPLTRDYVAANSRNRGMQPRIESRDGAEIWTYERGNSWCGAMVVVVPLMLPVCSQDETYVFDGDTVVEHRTRFVDLKGAGCSIFPVCSSATCQLCVVE